MSDLLVALTFRVGYCFHYFVSTVDFEGTIDETTNLFWVITKLMLVIYLEIDLFTQDRFEHDRVAPFDC